MNGTAFTFISPDHLLLVYRQVVDFCVLTLCSVRLSNSWIGSVTFSRRLLGFLHRQSCCLFPGSFQVFLFNDRPVHVLLLSYCVGCDAGQGGQKWQKKETPLLPCSQCGSRPVGCGWQCPSQPGARASPCEWDRLARVLPTATGQHGALPMPSVSRALSSVRPAGQAPTPLSGLCLWGEAGSPGRCHGC